MKIRIIKGKLRGTRGKVVGVYMDGRFDIDVTNRKPNQPKHRVVKVSDCQEVR
jgi:ribosomal protein L24